MKTVELSARMQALVDMVSEDMKVCDVGCDHGFVSIYLVQKGIASKVYAMDVRTGPLERAKEHIRECKLENYIETRLSDGLGALQIGEADCMICAGMGGKLMLRILQEGREKAHVMSELILQPQSEIALFRAFLRKEGYQIVEENMIYEEGKYYPMMKVIPQKVKSGKQVEVAAGRQYVIENTLESQVSEETALWDRYGELLLKQKHPVLKQYLEHSKEYMSELLQGLEAQGGERVKERAVEIREELRMIQKAQAYMK